MSLRVVAFAHVSSSYSVQHYIMSSKTSKTAEPAPAQDIKAEDKVGFAPALPVPDEILANIALIGRGVSSMEPRFTIRVLRTLTTLRKKLDRDALRTAIEQALPKGSRSGHALLSSSVFTSLPAPAPKEAAIAPSESMDVDSSATAASTTAATAPAPAPGKKYVAPTDGGDLIPEGIVYLRLLVILLALDAGLVEPAGEFASQTVDYIGEKNRRSMDAVAAKVWFYLARAYEIQGKLAELRPALLAARQTAKLRKDEALEIMTLNLLLRSYLQSNLFDQADKLLSKIETPSSSNSAQTARWLFYVARLRAVQLNYAGAADLLLTAIRRAPKDEVAPGFVQIVHKYYIITEMLTGRIPDRAMFRRPVLQQALVPYFQIVQAVRVGDVAAFQRAFTAHEQTFFADSTHFLILRLRHFVIRTALRNLTLAYSRISLRDVCAKLGLESEEDTEFIVAKAIKDRVIEATIDHVGGYMQSKSRKEVYETEEPQAQVAARLKYALSMHNEALQGMRYAIDTGNKDLETVDAARERDREIAQLIQEDEDDFDDL
ncbi:26S proteasome non-ATPase regulatory subunit [Cryptotrichosporon argae]